MAENISQQSSSPLSVAIVDDDSYWGEQEKEICFSLVPEGSDIKVYTDPLHGLQSILRVPVPDLVLLDLEMPELDGLKILQQIKQTRNHIRVIIISATDPKQGTDALFQKIFQEGDMVLGYISKEVPVEYMKGQIRAVVQLILQEKKNKEILQNMERQKILFEQLFLADPNALVVLDRDDRVVELNPAFTKLFGYTIDEAKGKRINDLIVPSTLKKEGQQLTNKVAHDEPISKETKRNTKDGKSIDVHILGVPVPLPGSDVLGEDKLVFGIYQDITERKKNEDLLLKIASEDPLTALPNRRAFEQTLKHILAQYKQKQQYIPEQNEKILKGVLAVLFLDLDHFKEVNDTYGHDIGDTLLKIVAHRLQKSLRASDMVARDMKDERHASAGNNHTVSRLGGDEFLILLQGIGERKDIEVVVQKIMRAINTPFKIQGIPAPLHVGGSIGIVFYPDHIREAKDLIHHADEAMRAAKEAGKGRYVFYDDLPKRDHPDDQE
jgi:PAS domain S-box-containing protein